MEKKNKLISHIHSFNFPIFAKVCLNIFGGVQNFIIEAKHALKAIGKGTARKKYNYHKADKNKTRNENYF